MSLSKKRSLLCFLLFLFVPLPAGEVFKYSILRPIIYLFKWRHFVDNLYAIADDLVIYNRPFWGRTFLLSIKFPAKEELNLHQ